MADIVSSVGNAEDSKPETGWERLDDQLVEQLVGRARAGGLRQTGEGAVLQQLTSGCWRPRRTVGSPVTWAIASRTRPATGPATHATAPTLRLY